ncbi:MAG: Fe-S cluster assembly ATPase SufC [Halobacteria archaeon]
MLRIENLTVSVEGKRILKNVNLNIDGGEIHALLGPNGCGKTSLLMTIMGIPKYKVEFGRIFFKGNDITELPINERAKLGIGLAFQHPPVLRGVKLRDILSIALGEKDNQIKKEEASALARRLNFGEDFLNRDVNLGFSGGEIKRSELLQLLALKPDFLMLDEPDSGIDLVNIHLVGEVINELLERGKRMSKRTKCGLIITHFGHILNYVKVDRAHIMMDGMLMCSGNPLELLEDIKEKGYEGCITCLR